MLIIVFAFTCLSLVVNSYSVAARYPTPYLQSYSYDTPGRWLGPYEVPVDAVYYSDDLLGLDYGYREPYVIRRRYEDEDWFRRGEDHWYYDSPRPARIRIGRGRYRFIGPSDAELYCQFPESEVLVSNILWVRADVIDLDTRRLYRINQDRTGVSSLYPRVRSRGRGSTLFLNHVTPLDSGLYRCLATAQGSHGRVYTVFQDVEFFPDVWHKP